MGLGFRVSGLGFRDPSNYVLQESFTLASEALRLILTWPGDLRWLVLRV